MKYKLLLVIAVLAMAPIVPGLAQAHTTGAHSHCVHDHAAQNWGGLHLRYGGRCHFWHGHSWTGGPPNRNSSTTIPGGPTGPDGVWTVVSLFAMLGIAGVGGAMIARRQKLR